MTRLIHQVRRTGLRYKIVARGRGPNDVDLPIRLRFWTRTRADLVAAMLDKAYVAGARDERRLLQPFEPECIIPSPRPGDFLGAQRERQPFPELLDRAG